MRKTPGLRFTPTPTLQRTSMDPDFHLKQFRSQLEARDQALAIKFEMILAQICSEKEKALNKAKHEI